jgi:hypothetical protein
MANIGHCGQRKTASPNADSLPNGMTIDYAVQTLICRPSKYSLAQKKNNEAATNLNFCCLIPLLYAG